MSDDTVHILNPTALCTYQMVMVVADPGFIERGGVCGFDTPYQSRVQQSMKIIVHGLLGKTAEAFPGSNGDGFGVEVPSLVDRRQHRETRRCYAHPHRPQPFL